MGKSAKKEIILASASPRRCEILKLLELAFTVIPSPAEPPLPENVPIGQAVLQVAEAKARAVFADNPRAAVIGADTVVAIDKRVLGKPKDADDAKRMLSLLSGKAHTVLTAVYVCTSDFCRGFTESSQVEFALLTPEEIDRYVATGEPLDKAGSYGIQGYGLRFIRSISGDFYTIMRFPASRFYSEFKLFFKT